ncbi:MAG: cereblon family protein [Rhodospirillales bacterium]
MLKIAPETDLEDDVAELDDDEIYCAVCSHTATRGRWRISKNGEHKHTLANPLGRVFRVLCFKEAPGVAGSGDATPTFTWFPGYEWQLAFCRGCKAHMGWLYAREDSPGVFFGLIQSALSSTKQ